MRRPGFLTAITIYFLVVGLAYQVVLRNIWSPERFQLVVDELLHTFIPMHALVFRYAFEEKHILKWSMIPSWLLYPAICLAYFLVRGSTSGFYPDPFVDVDNIGLSRVMINASFLMLLFTALSVFMIWLGKLRRGIPG